MMRDAGDAPRSRPSGFTLIEVIAALVVFSTAVLMATSLTAGLTTQMRFSALRSQVAARAVHRLDSMAVLPYDSVPVSVSLSTYSIQGQMYRDSLKVVQFAPRIREVQVSLSPVSSCPPTCPAGPRYRVVTYLVKPW
jgi:prepilin-type N-terminal cleavage/methylation domain-containing protein